MMLTTLALLAACTVKINCNYEGGNVKVVEIKPDAVTVDSDLRDTPRDWFYWNFETEADGPGTVRFSFPEQKWRISAQGPAVSTDGGKSWKWLGKAKCHFYDGSDKHDWFDWTYTKAGEKVRFSQNIPYLKSDLDRFLASKKGNPELKIGVHAKTRKGTEVPLLTIGHGPTNVLMTVRHHACEASPSYVVEGILDEILSGSVFGKAFCDRFTLSCVPMVDVDGVIAGDQGKGRAPHDHNRDYAVVSNLYPEVKAIMDLDEQKKFFIALDFHSPALRGDVHESFYLTGVKTPELMQNSNDLIAWALEEFPDLRMLNQAFKASPDSFKEGKPFSVYFGFRPHVAYGTTLEVAYACANPRYDAAFGRQYGHAFLRALVRADIRKSAEPRKAYAHFAAISKRIPARTDQYQKAVDEILSDPATTPAERATVQLRIAEMGLRYGWLDKALAACDAVLAEPWATGRQRGAAFARKAELLCRADSKATDDDRAAHLKAFEAECAAFSCGARFDFAQAYADWRQRAGDRAGARAWVERQLKDADGLQSLRVRNRLAGMDLADGKKDEAAARARETAKIAKAALTPVPYGIQGPLIAIEYVRALKMVPETTPEELKSAADIGLKHHICQPWMKKEFESLLK